jgi:hypothetical protein
MDKLEKMQTILVVQKKRILAITVYINELEEETQKLITEHKG